MLCPNCGYEDNAYDYLVCARCGHERAFAPSPPPPAAAQSGWANMANWANTQTQAGRPPDPSPFPPGAPPSARQRERRTTVWVVSGMAVILVLAIAATAVFVTRVSGHQNAAATATPTITVTRVPTENSPGTVTPTVTTGAGMSGISPAEQTQAAQLASLLSESGNARAQVISTVQDVGDCQEPAQIGVGIMQAAAAQRSTMLTDMGSLATDSIPGGSVIVTDLRQAIQYSYYADESFVNWMQDMELASCPMDSQNDAWYNEAATFSTDASSAKQAFIGLWNPLAAQLGLSQYTADEV